jgi:hypothetical protein
MTLWDKMLVVLVIAVSVAGMFLVSVIRANAEQDYVVVEVDGKLVKKISVRGEPDGRVYDFGFGSNTGYIEVKDGAVRMLEMDRKICPRGICSDTGWISKSYQSIVCLPNRINVRFAGKDEGDLDVISY